MSVIDSMTALAPGAEVRILGEKDIRELIRPSDALRVVRDAFARLARGQAGLPAVMIIEVPENGGEVHVKGAHIHGLPFYSVKFASVFSGNPSRGLPANSGMVLAFDATSGFLSAILLENGFLTDLRTGAAGALAADVLARREVSQVGIIGTGTQGRFQLEALLEVRKPERVLAYDRDETCASAYASEMQVRHQIPVTAVQSAQEAVRASDIVICSTTSEQPYLMPEWLSAGTHVTAMGSDNPTKHELYPGVLARADKIVADSLSQCLAQGEIHHAVEQGVLRPEAVYAELGEIAAGLKPGRTSDQEITVADLTGVGVQDTAVASFVLGAALPRIPLG